MKMTLSLACVAVVAAVCTAMARAENTNVAEVRPVAVIPLMAKAPAISGVIDPNEWKTLHISRFVSQSGDVLQRRMGEFWVGCDGKKLYIAVRSAVHPVAGVVAKIPKPPGSKDEGGVVMDDSIELWINNNPGGQTGQYYQIMVNSLGAIYDAMFELHDKVALTYWRVDMEQAHKVEGGVWTAVFAIDLKSINVSDPTKPLGIRVCRNYKNGWDQSRWAPLVRSFDSPETMPLVRFSPSAPVVSELGFQDKEGINIAVEVSNPTDKPLALKGKIGSNAENQPRYYKEFSADLKPGEKQVWANAAKLFTSEDYPALGSVLITDAAGEVLYTRDFKWHTQPKGSAWAQVGAVPAEEATQFAIEFHPTPKILRWKVSFPNMKDKEKVKALRVEVADAKTGAKIAEQVVKDFKDFAAEMRLTLDKLPDGRFEARLFLDGDSPAAKPIKSAVFDYISNFPWLNNKIGVSDEVIPPFTPLMVKDQTVSAILRDHQMTDIGLWKQVVSKGKEILAGPMRLEIRQADQVIAAKGELKFTATKPNQVIAESAWTAGPLAGKTVSEFDYDGCMKVTLEFGPGPQHKEAAPIDGMELIIPMRDQAAPLMHTCGDGMRINYAGVVPAGEGVVWTSATASRINLLGTFIPYLYLGAEERGLAWFASNDRDWVLDMKEKVPALVLERRNGQLLLHISLVQTPSTIDRPHKIVFGLMATPAKPMPENPNWRTWGMTSGATNDVRVLGMCGYWGGQLYSVFPRQRDFTIVQKIAQAQKEGKADRAFFEDYAKKYPDIKGEVMWSSNPGRFFAVVPYTNIRGAITYTPEWRVYQDEWQRGNFRTRQTDANLTEGGVDFSVITPPSRADFLLYYYREFLKNGFDGIYWDNICIYSNDNPITGNGYVRPDGAFQPDTDIWLVREVTKRTAVLSHQLGKVQCSIPHMTNADIIPFFSWTGMTLDWEWKYGGTDFQERFTRDYIRATSIGLQCGNVPLVLNGITEVRDPNDRKWVERTRIAVTIPHELRVWEADALYSKVLKQLFAIGYGQADCKVYRYWDQDSPVKIEGEDMIYLAVDGKDTVALVLGDYGSGGAAKVALDTARLHLPADFTAANWEDPKDTVQAAGGVITVPNIKKHDFRVLLIQKSALQGKDAK